jgi:alkylation response protein AidB-like acyl-CoA dehydrogenase
MQIADAAMKIDTAALHVAARRRSRSLCGRRAADDPSRARPRPHRHGARGEVLRDAVEILVQAHGTSSLADSNRMQRLWRDAHTASHHAITEWQVNSRGLRQGAARRRAEHHAFDLTGRLKAAPTDGITRRRDRC